MMKNSSSGSVRAPAAPMMVTDAPKATRMVARSEGCTMLDGPVAKMAFVASNLAYAQATEASA